MLVLRKLIVFVLFGALGSSDASLASGKATNRVTAAVSPPLESTAVLSSSLRGGAGPLSAQRACQLLTLAAFLDGGLAVLSAKKSLKNYGVVYSPLNELWLFEGAKHILSLAVLAFCLLEKKMSLNVAIGSSSLTLALADLKVYRNEDYKANGSTQVGALFPVVLHGAAAVVGLTNQAWAETFYKIYYAFGLANGVGFAYFGDQMMSVYGCKALDVASKALTKMLGHWMLGQGAMGLCLLKGVAKERAFGAVSLSALAMTVVDLLITKDLTAAGMKQVSILIMTALQTLFVVSIYL